MNEAREEIRSATRQEVYEAIDSERDYQDSRWNASTTTSRGIHSQTEWLAYIQDYTREAQHILARTARHEARAKVNEIMRKLAAMAVCAMEEHGVFKR